MLRCFRTVRNISKLTYGRASSSQVIYLLVFNICCSLPHFGTIGAFPFGRLTCVLSALPISPWSIRPRNRPPLPALRTLWETALWLVLFYFWWSCVSVEFSSNVCCDIFTICSWQKGDRPDNGNVEPCSIQTKKIRTVRNNLATSLAR